MPPLETQVAPGRLHRAALVFAIAAALASWNPLAAPVGLVVGVAAAIMAARALARQMGHRRAALVALGIASVSTLASLGFMLSVSGAWRGGLETRPVAPARSEREVETLLDEAAKRTAKDRGQASEQLAREPAAPNPRPAADSKRKRQPAAPAPPRN
jgi:hypothetical protein